MATDNTLNTYFSHRYYTSSTSYDHFQVFKYNFDADKVEWELKSKFTGY